MEPRAKKIRLDPTHIPASIPEEVRTYEEWASYPVDVLQLVCSQVGLAPAGSVHEMARRLVGFFQLAGAGAAGGPGTSPAGGNAGTWSPSAAPVASVPAVPPPMAPPMVPPFQFARLGLAADVPEEVIQPFHDLAQEVVPLRRDELTSLFRDAIRREAIALTGLVRAAGVVRCRPCHGAHPPPSGASRGPRPSSPARPTSHGSVSHSGLATPPPPLLEKLRTCMYVDFQSILHASEGGGGAALHPDPVVHSLTTQGVTLDVAMAPRFRRTRISDYLTWSQAWVVYFEATVRYHPHLLPHLAAYQVDMNRYARDYPPHAWVAFDAEFRQSVANNPGPWTACTPWRSIAICAALLLPPPVHATTAVGEGGGSGHPAVRHPPAGRPTHPIGSGRRGGLCRDYNARSCTRAACRYEHRCTRCGGTHPAVSCPPLTSGTARFASWRGASLPVGPRSPVNARRLRALLRGHPRRALVRYLWSGFMFGFALGYRGPVTAARPRNLLSPRSRRPAVTVAVALEVSRGHTAGPFVHPPFRLFHCSPLGAAVNPGGSVRLILDLSSPRGASI